MSFKKLIMAAMADKYANKQAKLASDDLNPMKRAKLERKVARLEDRFGFMPDAEMPEAIMKRGGKVKKMAKGGSTASKRADGCATKGKTRGKMV